jgi:hypothetical protein
VVDVAVPATTLYGSIRMATASKREDPVVKGVEGRSGEARSVTRKKMVVHDHDAGRAAT